MKQRRTRLLAIAASLTVWLCIGSFSAVAARTDRYPGVEWDRTTPGQAGWSAAKLDQAAAWSQQIGTTAVVIVQHGVVVASWGEINANILLNSARKSLLSALIGIAVNKHQVDLRDTLAKLGIDDNAPPLTVGEKQATVGDLLEARSGVYHPANYETPQMAARRPPRGSHPPGTFWYYNNCDFNTLGASARDLARFGLLYMHRGLWRDRQIIAASWIDDSVRPYSTTDIGSGYGYLWWTTLPERALASMHLPAGSYFANGNGAPFIFVIPGDDLVVVHLARMGAQASSARRDGVSRLQAGALLGMILDAASVR